MFLAEVIGQVVSTKKDELMVGRKLLLLRPKLIDDKDPSKFKDGQNTIVAIDTVGAGDSFSAALLAGLHRRGLLGATARDDLYRIDRPTLEAVLTEAVAASAITCSRHGANPPTRAELDAAV